MRNGCLLMRELEGKPKRGHPLACKDTRVQSYVELERIIENETAVT